MLRPIERPDHQHQAAGLANLGQPGGIALVRAAQAGRVDQLQRGQRDLLGMIDRAELFDPRGSGTAAMALCERWASAGSGFTPVSHSNNVLLPEP